MMIEEINKTIKKYFPARWTKKYIEFFIGKPRFLVNVKAIDNSLNAPLRNFILRGGKRWRPVLFLTLLKLFGLDYKKYLDIAFSIELVHNGTLIIDDIEDSAELRRGEKTCHKIFGLDVAVNVGAAAHFLATQIIAKNNKLTEMQKLRILKIYNEEIIKVYFGQSLDIYWHKKPQLITKEEYLEMCRLKTGGLVRMAVRIASAVANKSHKLEKDLEKFAELIGVAFQVIDDSLDLINSDKLGKSFGNDITEGKLSLPVVLALHKIDKQKKERLIEILKSHTHNLRLLKEANKIIKDSGTPKDAIIYAGNLAETAWQKIEKKLPQNETLKELKNLVDFLISRDH